MYITAARIDFVQGAGSKMYSLDIAFRHGHSPPSCSNTRELTFLKLISVVFHYFLYTGSLYMVSAWL